MDDPSACLTSFSEILDNYQTLLESFGFRSAADAIFDARLIICSDFISSLSTNPVFVSALRIILHNQSIPSLPASLSEAVGKTELPAQKQVTSSSSPPSAKEQAQVMAHAFGCYLLPLVKQANAGGKLSLNGKSLFSKCSVFYIFDVSISGQTFNNSLKHLFSAIYGAVTRQ
jgi:hypothetical protein